VIGAEGGAPRRLTSGDFMEEPPGWSRDGKWVYFTSNRGDGDALWRVPASGGSPILVARDGWEPLESSNERFVYYSGPEETIWKVATGGGSPILLARKGRPPVVESSDGKLVYYSGPNDSIWKVPSTGGEAAQVLRIGKRAFWTSSAAGIYVLDPDAEDGPAIEHFRFAIQRGEVLRLPGEPDSYVLPPGGVAHTTASSDGRWMMYLHRHGNEPKIMLVDHFR
jgi:hypothetical protein